MSNTEILTPTMKFFEKFQYSKSCQILNPFSIAIFLQRSILTYLLKDSIFPKRPILRKVFSHIKLPLGAFLLPRNSGYSGWDVNGQHHLPVACVAAGPRVGLDYWRRFRVSATQTSIRAFQ